MYSARIFSLFGLRFTSVKSLPSRELKYRESKLPVMTWMKFPMTPMSTSPSISKDSDSVRTWSQAFVPPRTASRNSR